MDKKTIIKIAIILGIFIIIGIILYFVLDDHITADEHRFKTEYEELNNKKNDKGKKYPTVHLPKDNNVTYASFDDVMNLLDDGTGILYLGFPECPWCRNALPVLIDAAKKSEVDNVYYFNAEPIRDTKTLDAKGKRVTTKKGTKEYYKLVEKLKDYLDPYDGLNDESIKRIYFPTVVFVMGGKVVGIHTDTVESQSDPYKGLTKKQKEELNQIYTNNINKIYGTCNESC